MTKQELGAQIKALREKKGISTYQLEQAGIRSHTPATIEKAEKGYTIDTLIKYLDECGLELSVGKNKSNQYPQK